MNTFYRSPGSYTVRVGTSTKSIGGVVYRVQSYLRHENFVQSTIDWDFALLRLDQSIRFNENAKPIKLVSAQQQLKDRTVCLVTGL